MNGAEAAGQRLTTRLTGRLTAHTALLLISNVGGAACSVLLYAVIGRGLGAAGLGAYAAAAAWIYPLSLLADFGVSSWLTRELARDLSRADAYLRAAALHRIVWGGALLIGLVPIAPLLSSDPAVQRGLIVGAPLIVILPLYSGFTAVFRAAGDFRAIPLLNVGMIAAQVVLTTAGIALGGGLLAALIANTVTSAGQVIAAWALYRWRFYQPDDRPRPALESVTRAAFHFALAGVFAALTTRLSLILLEIGAGAVAVGVFTAALRVVDAARLLPNALFGALFPALSALAADPSRLNAALRRSRRVLLTFGLAVILGGWIGGGWVIALVFGAGFADAVPVLHLLLIGLAFNALRGLATLRWYAAGREAGVNAVNAAALIALLIASALLIPAAGGIGAALALLIAEVIGWLLLDTRRARR